MGVRLLGALSQNKDFMYIILRRVGIWGLGVGVEDKHLDFKRFEADQESWICVSKTLQ